MTLTYAKITIPAEWPDAFRDHSIHEHLGSNGFRDYGDGTGLIEIPARAITVVEEEYGGETYNVVEVHPLLAPLVDVVRTHGRQLYVQRIWAAEAMTVQDLQDELDAAGVDSSGFTERRQGHVALARQGNAPNGRPNSELGPPNWTMAEFSAWTGTQTVAELGGYCWRREIDIHNVSTLAGLKQRIGEETGSL